MYQNKNDWGHLPIIGWILLALLFGWLDYCFRISMIKEAIKQDRQEQTQAQGK